mgnify:CR=1 FL=1
MSRPKPTILLNYTDPKTFKSEQVLEASGIYAVYYQGKPINLRTLNSVVCQPTLKYLKVSFSNKGHAFNLCEKLNKRFKTDQFSVVLLHSGTVISED